MTERASRRQASCRETAFSIAPLSGSTVGGGSLRDALRQGAIRSAARDVDVVVGALGDRAEVLGAVALALRSGAVRT